MRASAAALLALLMGFPLAAPAAGKGEPPSVSSVRACYAEAPEKDAGAKGRCLGLELERVRFDYKTVADRVASNARAQDKKAGGGSRWNKVVAAGQAFETYVRRDCELVEATASGSRQTRINAGLACRVGHYRMRASVLSNRHLEQGN